MNRIILITCLLITFSLSAQTDGLTYQALIIDENPQEIPGMDITGNYLKDAELSMRFSIQESTGQVIFQEVHDTKTDEFGMVNLVIGHGEQSPSSLYAWDQIDWDGNPKDLIVEIDLSGNGFESFSTQALHFVPYAYHRNITATGTLTVDQESLLNDDLVVANQSPTILTGTLDVIGDGNFEGHNEFNTVTVFNETDLQSDVSVGGNTSMEGTLNVEGASSFQSSLEVAGSTDLLGDLHVHGNTQLDNTLDVGGASTLSSTLDVAGMATLSDDLHVLGNTDLDGQLNVDGRTYLNDRLDVENEAQTTLSGDLQVEGETRLNYHVQVFDTINHHSFTRLKQQTLAEGQVTINVEFPTDDDNYDRYPLRIEGSGQGLAIKSVAGTPNGFHNFITFFDVSEAPIGRIEGQTAAEVLNSGEYLFETAILAANIVSAGAGLVGASTSSTICAGLGGCVTAPIPSLVVSAGINSASAVANMALYQTHAFNSLGVTYESGSADYAEWLMRKDQSEQMNFGDVVAVSGGQISKGYEEAERFMVISHKPAVLGNMPASGEEHLYEMVAFLGQVPVKVYGPVKVGDFIVPSGLQDGFARAISPDKMKAQDFRNLIGTSWSSMEQANAGYVNVAIGMNQNALAMQVEKQESELAEIRKDIAELKDLIMKDPGVNHEHLDSQEIKAPLTAEEMHGMITDQEIDAAFEQLRIGIEQQGIDIASHPYLSKIFTDAESQAEMKQRIKEMAEQQRGWAVEYDRARGY